MWRAASYGVVSIDNESRELILLGHAFSIASEAGQIFRPTPNSGWGIDGEIEFKNDKGEASGRRVYFAVEVRRLNTSDGVIRWMNVTEYLKKQGQGIKQVVFDGEPFTAQSVWRMRDHLFR